MRANRFVIAAITTALLAIPAIGQVLTDTVPPAPPNRDSGPFGPLGAPWLTSNIGVLAWSTNGVQRTNFFARPRLARPKGRVPSAPKPGVYRTEPYACIVVVPGKHPDDRSVVKPGDPGPPMPVVRPELRFIPFRPK